MTQLAIDFTAAPYFNTTSLSGGELSERKRAVAAQEAAVIGVLTTHGELGPWQVQEQLQARGYDWPITSIRRAITGLTRRDLLVKTTRWHVGPHGMREHVWALPERGVAA